MPIKKVIHTIFKIKALMLLMGFNFTKKVLVVLQEPVLFRKILNATDLKVAGKSLLFNKNSS
jgi:hypothetical protein